MTAYPGPASGSPDSESGSNPDISAYGFTSATSSEAVSTARVAEAAKLCSDRVSVHDTPPPTSYNVAYLFSRIDRVVRLLHGLHITDDLNLSPVFQDSLRELRSALISMTENHPLDQAKFNELRGLLHDRFGMVFDSRGELVIDAFDTEHCPAELASTVQACRLAIASTLRSLNRLPAV